ncbi:hypothetical protein PTRA_a1894 [Pseudoalteromonas translucida KMM 520]|uniref:Uncharacterized protein n=1 Tax=Pseudoalteromonas translucida KMM 520 TaxID=1315283 RepID=A0A0U2ISL1_9GAMM|nr:hypothetical protein PTRA_a1894 [Pseudoalteromonas translucida KMM 520]
MVIQSDGIKKLKGNKLFTVFYIQRFSNVFYCPLTNCIY